MLNRDDLPRVRNMVADIARGILNRSSGQIEVINDFCRMVPATLVQKYFGLTGAKRSLGAGSRFSSEWKVKPFVLFNQGTSGTFVVMPRASEGVRSLAGFVDLLLTWNLGRKKPPVGRPVTY